MMRQRIKRDGVLQTDMAADPVAKKRTGGGTGVGAMPAAPGAQMIRQTKAAPAPTQLKRRDHTGVARMGENIAALWLSRHGYRIIERNWRSGRLCEIDIVARQADGLLVFVEVKTRRLTPGPEPKLASPITSTLPADSWTQHQAFESLNWRKRRKLLIAARSYIARHRILSDSCRLDAVVITYKCVMQDAGELRLDGVSVFHVPGAFSEI